MAVDVDWAVLEKTRLVIEFHDTLTWDEFRQGIRQAHAMIREESHPVHMLIWIKADLPPGNALHHFITASKEQPSNTGRLVIVMPPGKTSVMASFMKRLGQIVAQILPRKSQVLFADSYEEGQKLLMAEAQVDSAVK
jgi:hypothetical protein